MPSETSEISKSVGENGKNLESDVKTIQKLLNGIAENDGGPSPPLKVDGKCGPKTKGAIQKFQLHHFGWKLADSRVDPEGLTHNKMRLMASQQQWKGRIFQIRRMQKDEVDVPPTEPYFFEVLDWLHKRRALYTFSNFQVNPAYIDWMRSRYLQFEGSPFSLTLSQDHDVTELSGNAQHRTVTFLPNAPWPDLNIPRYDNSMIFRIFGLIGPFEVAEATVPFKTTTGLRFGRFEFQFQFPYTI